MQRPKATALKIISKSPESGIESGSYDEVGPGERGKKKSEIRFEPMGRRPAGWFTVSAATSMAACKRGNVAAADEAQPSPDCPANATIPYSDRL
jgi:hypothetical protein